MYDLAIIGGLVLDGSGKPPFRADIGIRGNKIVSLGSIPRAAARSRFSQRASFRVRDSSTPTATRI